MRIAWVSPYVPTPEDSGGRIRISRFARVVAKSHELHLYTRVGDDDHDWVQSTSAKPFGPWNSVHAEPWTQSAGRSWVWNPPEWARRFPADLGARLALDHLARPFDVLVLEHSYAASPVPQLPDVKVVLNEHNVESGCRSRAVLASTENRASNAIDFVRWRRWERKVWRSADAIAVVSESDAQAVRKVRPDSVTVIPNGIDLGKYRYTPPSQRRGSAILFLGLLSWEPNRRAAHLLANQVLPELRKIAPQATLTLAGRDPSPDIRALASDVVRVTGTLNDVAPLFDEHAAFAMPLLLGGGSSLKVLEPLATGLPLVATEFAIRGYPLLNEQNYVRAEDPVSMAHALARVLEQRESFDDMAERGRKFVQRYDWNDLGSRFAGLVETAARARR